MSECVVRMEMPLNCLECPMYDYNRHKLCCNAHFDLRPIPNGGVPKPDWCPIICQLPEGHGRLVDADDCIKHLFTEWVKGEISNSEWCNIRQCMNEETTIVPEERSET